MGRKNASLADFDYFFELTGNPFVQTKDLVVVIVTREIFAPLSCPFFRKLFNVLKEAKV